jgi:Carboxypeptidase regulatory-like domain
VNFKKLIAIILLFPFITFADEKAALPLPAAGNVTLPLDEYNHLLELANKPARKADAPPLPYTIKRADLKLRVDEDSARATIQLQGEVLSHSETKVALASGLTVLDARQEGKSLPLEQVNGTHVAILPGASEFNVTLEAGLQLAIDAGRASFTIPTPSAGSARLSLVVPGDHTNVRLSPGIITNRASENGVTTIEATLVPGAMTNVWWTTREVVAPVVPKEVRFLTDVKTLVSVSEADIRIAALADVTIVQGEPTQFEIEVPAGYELTGVTGAYLETSELKSGVLELKLAEAPQKTHQFLISLEKNIAGTSEDAPFLTFKNTQRETGEVLVEGSGTIELTSKEGGSLKRMDFKELNPYLRSLGRFPAQAGFRYHRQPNESPTLALEWTRFPDSSVLAAIAERATVTTLVTSEGKSLTEVKLLVRNQAQPYVKVALPTGASILSAEVAGEKVKPVEGSDGNRVPLLRAGFRPNGAYTVSFVFMHSGSPFAKKGGSELSLPKMDLPIDLLQWEVFLPERYQVKDFGGDAISALLLPVEFQPSGDFEEVGDTVTAPNAGNTQHARVSIESLLPGQIAGFVVDPSGAVIPNARVTVSNPATGFSQTTTTDDSGRWVVSGLRSGNAKITVQSTGFQPAVQDVNYDSSRPVRYSIGLRLGAVTETVEVSALSTAPMSSSEIDHMDRKLKRDAEQKQLTASANVYNFQRKVSGVLPVRVDVPRAGNSYRFVRPLVLDEETKVTFSYKTK